MIDNHYIWRGDPSYDQSDNPDVTDLNDPEMAQFFAFRSPRPAEAEIGDRVKVTFSDGASETGVLGADRGGEIDVEVTADGNTWTATYGRTGDDDTPAVVSVKKITTAEVAEGFDAPALF